MGSNLINVSLSRTGRVRYAQMTQWGSFEYSTVNGSEPSEGCVTHFWLKCH